MHLSGQQEPHLELFAPVALREGDKENSSTFPTQCEDQIAGVLTACGQTNASVDRVAGISCRFATGIGMRNYQSHLRDYWHEPSSTN